LPSFARAIRVTLKVQGLELFWRRSEATTRSGRRQGGGRNDETENLARAPLVLASGESASILRWLWADNAAEKFTL
jgi:hypothetical protein